MATSHVLETPRLRIEPFTDCHLTERYVSWLNDASTVRFSEQRHRKHTLQSCREYMQSLEASPHYFWAVNIRSSAVEHIGNVNAYVDDHNSIADVGILIGVSEAQRKGYATEAWLAVCDYLLRVRGMRKVCAGTIAPNLPMLKVMERTGMISDGYRFHHYLWNHEEVNIIYSAFFQRDWLAKYPNGPFVNQ